MDIVTGSTTGRDALRSFLRASATIDDSTVQQCWDAAVDATQRYIRPGYTTNAPAGVLEFVLHVGGVIFKHRDSGGESAMLPDGSITTGGFLSQGKIKTLAAAYGGPYVVTPRVIV